MLDSNTEVKNHVGFAHESKKTRTFCCIFHHKDTPLNNFATPSWYSTIHAARDAKYVPNPV